MNTNSPTNPIIEAREALDRLARHVKPELNSPNCDRFNQIYAALDYAETQASLVAECAEYLKEGQTPLQRIEQDHKDILALMELLHGEKVKTETQAAEIERLNKVIQSNHALYEERAKDGGALIDTLKAKLAKAEEDLDEARARLKPFGACASRWEGEDDDLKMEVRWWKPVTAYGPVDFYLSDLRNASQFTKGEEG